MTSAVVVAAVAWGVASPAGAASAKAKLHTELLTLAQLPKGFLLESASSVEVFGCAASAFPTGATATASVGFNYKAVKDFPLVTEVAGEFKSPTAAYATLTSGLASCPKVSGTFHGGTFSGTIAKMSFASYPDASEAFGAKVDLGGTELVDDILIVQRGDVLLDVQEANTGAVSASAFKAVAAAAVNRL